MLATGGQEQSNIVLLELKQNKAMNANQPQVNKDARYSINETCNFLGIHRHTLRAWTQLGLIKSITRKSNGRPAYRGADILACWGAVI